MKIPLQNTDAFIKKIPENIAAALIYGPDNGLVKERLIALSRAITPSINDPFIVTDLTYERIKESPVLLSDALAELNLFGGRRLVRLTSVPANLDNALIEIIANHKQGAFFIVTSGELSPSSNVRKLFETEAHLAAIACYNDEGSGLKRIIEMNLTAAGLQYEPAVIAYLQQSLAGDRLLIMQELDKLISYMGREKHITLEDVESCISRDPLEASLEALSLSLAEKNSEKIQMHMQLLSAEGVSPIAILRSTSNYFMRLYTVKTLLEQGMPENQAMMHLRPPVFFKQLPAFAKHLQLWTVSGLLATLRNLSHLEAECKKTASPAELLCRQYLTLIGAKKIA